MVSHVSTAFSSAIFFSISWGSTVGTTIPGSGKDMGFHIFCMNSNMSLGKPGISAIADPLRRGAAQPIIEAESPGAGLLRGEAGGGGCAGAGIRGQRLFEALLLVHHLGSVLVFAVPECSGIHL